jgi:hypothetical protein
MMKLFIIIISLFLFGCFGTELFKLGGIGIKTGDIITVPNKIETFNKFNNKENNGHK